MSEHQRNLYNLEIREILEHFATTPTGITQDEARQRQAEYGPNALTAKKASWFKRLIEPFASAFVVVLMAAAAISVYEHEYVDAVIIAVIVGVNAIIYYAQQYSVSRVLRTLRDADVAYVHVIRDGETVRIRSEELTFGDVVHVEEGAKIPADGRLIEASQVQADEALLTGESLPVHKHAGAIEGIKEVYDQKNMLFKGTYVKAGTGLMVVTAIGDGTQLGTISALAGNADQGKSPIERKIDDFTKKLILVIIAVASLALVLEVYRGIAVDEALRFALVIMVSAVPEGLPVALTIVLLLSARRMAKVHALVKKISSIETMGAITMIATDKTGTITQNKLSVAERRSTHSDDGPLNEAIRASVNTEGDRAVDVLDAILLDGVAATELPKTWRKVADFPFSQQLRMSGVLWEHAGGFMLYVKGAPEHVVAHSRAHHNSSHTNDAIEDFAGKGYRTLAFAHKQFTQQPHHFDHDALQDLDFDGIVGLSDELRPNIKEAVEQAHHAGVKVVMLTGDHMATAGYIAKQVGIAERDDQVSESGVLDTGSPQDIREALKETRVFGRVLPEHKYALLKATKGHEITAMTGDGVNDIPALVEADTGLAMGSGTDAAKDASDIVLLDDNFHTIVNAIKVGRTALANVRKMLMYLLGTTSGAVLTILLALVTGIPVPVVAIQILWINLVTDGFTVIPLGLSPAESRHMQLPPRHPQAALLNGRQVSLIALMGIVTCASVLTVFHLNLKHGEAYAQTIAFMSLIVVQWANALNINYEYKSWIHNFVRPNWKLMAAIGVSIILNIFVFMTPFGHFLSVTSVSWKDAAVAVAVPVVASLIAVDIHKHLTRKMAQ